jgi:hypothetical protein
MRNLLFILLLSITSFKAKSAKTPEERATAIVNNLEYHLKINTEQKKAIYDLTISRIQEIGKVLANKDTRAAKVLKRTYVSDVKKIIGNEKAGQYESLRMQFVENKKAGKQSEFPVIDENLEFLLDKSE